MKPSLSTKNVVVPRTIMNVLAYADGQTDLLAISEIIGVDVMECAAAAVRLEHDGLLEKTVGKEPISKWRNEQKTYGETKH